MVKKNAIIRRIPAVETLGNASVICSDKTGTLTQNRMTIKKIWTINTKAKNAEEKFLDEEMKILEMMSLASNAVIEEAEGETKVVGDPTETAIIRLLEKKGIKKSELSEEWPRIFEIPFDSDRKLMTTVHKYENKYFTITKGAFDRISGDCTTESCELAQKIHDDFAKDALRVIAVGYKTYDELPENLTAEELEKDLILAGLVGMIDPPRPESKAAVAAAKRAGIRTVMITGDHIVTASAIARELGILSDGEKSITGRELSKMSEEELIKDVRDYSVYARVSPEDKIRIVKAWQANGEVVAMTGDGVNDAPALKIADIGIAMGISGTDVAKEAADIILLDDNFASIVNAIEEGRTVFENIRKFMTYILTSNIPEILPYIAFVIFRIPLPLTIIQILAVDLGTDMLPALALGAEPSDKKLMQQPPRPPKERLLSWGVVIRAYLWLGMLEAAASLFVFFFVLRQSGWEYGSMLGNTDPLYLQATTACLASIVMAQVINLFVCRHPRASAFPMKLSHNPMLWLGIAVEVVLILLVVYTPWGNELFGTHPLELAVWGLMIVLALGLGVLEEGRKLVARRFFSK